MKIPFRIFILMILYSLSYIKRIASAFFLFRASDEEEKEVNNKIIKKNTKFFYLFSFLSLWIPPSYAMFILFNNILFKAKDRRRKEDETYED